MKPSYFTRAPGSLFKVIKVLFSQSIRFTFDGQRVTGADTATSLGLEEGDTIEVFQVLSIMLFYFILFYSMFMYILQFMFLPVLILRVAFLSMFVHIDLILSLLCQEQQGGAASG